MDNFDSSYLLLEDMQKDSHYPKFLVDRIKYLLIDFIEYIENANRSIAQIQAKLDYLTIQINNLQEDFYENQSSLEPLAKECIQQNIQYILTHFKINIPLSIALRERNW